MSKSPVIQQLEEAGAEVEEYANGKINIRKNGSLIIWYPHSKRRAAQHPGGTWHSHVTIDKVRAWLRNAPRRATLPQDARTTENRPSARPAGDNRVEALQRVVMLLCDRVADIEKHLSSTGYAPIVDPHEAAAQKFAAFLADTTAIDDTDPAAAPRPE
jgi:hypothetical protein